MIQGINGKFQGVFNMLKMPDKALNAENNMSAFSAASVNTVSGTTPAQRAEDAKLQEMIHNARTSILAKSVNTAELSKQAKKISKLLENSVVGQLPRVGLFIETEVDAIGKYTELILDRSFSELSNCKDKSEVQNCVQRAMQEIQKEILKGKIYIKRGYKAIELDKKLSPIYNDPDKTKLVQGINIERIINALTSEPNVAEDTLPAAEAGLDSQVTSSNSGIGLDDAGDDPHPPGKEGGEDGQPHRIGKGAHDECRDRAVELIAGAEISVEGVAHIAQELHEQFAFEDMAGIYTKDGTSRMFAVCAKYTQTRGITVLPAGKYLCAECAESSRAETAANLTALAKREYHAEPHFCLQFIVISGILQWKYQIQVFVGNEGAQYPSPEKSG